jgi:hypothetical protein
MPAADADAARVVWFPKLADAELEAVHAAASAGEYRTYTGPNRPRDPHPPLVGGDYVRMRWPTHSHLAQPDRRDPHRQLPHARRAIARAREKTGFLADLQTWPTPEERVAAFRENALRGRARARSARAQELIRVRARLRELPPHVRRAVILAWNARTLPGDHLEPFIDRFLRGEITPVPELLLPADLLVLGCTAARDPSPERMPARRRFQGETMRFATGGTLLERGLSIVILSAELGLLRTWEGERGNDVLGPNGISMTAARAAELAAESEAASAFLHAVLVGLGAEERPPYRKVLVGGSALHQSVVEAWERAGVFRGAPLVYLPTPDPGQCAALASLYGIQPVSRCGYERPLQLPLL